MLIVLVEVRTFLSVIKTYYFAAYTTALVSILLNAIECCSIKLPQLSGIDSIREVCSL